MNPLVMILPALVANAAPPVLAKALPRWNAPVDLGATLNGERLFGSHKTWRGLLLGTLLGGLAGLALPAAWWYGLLLGLGALLGDLAESFAKRRLGRAPGKPFAPWDQVDYLLGAYALTAWHYWPGWAWFAAILLLGGLLSTLFHRLGHALGLNGERF